MEIKEFESHDEMDTLLRRSMAGPAPELSPSVAQYVTQRLRRRRLNAKSRHKLQAFSLAALIGVVAVMRWQGLEWMWIGGSLAATAALGAILRSKLR